MPEQAAAAKVRIGNREVSYSAAQVEHLELLLSATSIAEEASRLSENNEPVVVGLGDCTITVDFDR
jgi:hypothetical protein